MGHNTLKKISFTGLLLYVNFISLIWKPAAAPPLGLRRNSACNPGVRLTALRAAATELQLFRRYLHFIEQLRALCHNNQPSGRYWVLQRQPWLRLFFTNLTVAGGLCCLLKFKKKLTRHRFLFVCLFWGWPESVKKKQKKNTVTNGGLGGCYFEGKKNFHTVVECLGPTGAVHFHLTTTLFVINKVHF